MCQFLSESETQCVRSDTCPFVLQMSLVDHLLGVGLETKTRGKVDITEKDVLGVRMIEGNIPHLVDSIKFLQEKGAAKENVTLSHRFLAWN